jgi:hypothetical protein
MVRTNLFIHVPLSHYLGDFNSKLEAIILMHYHAVEIYLFEIGFYMPPTTVSSTSSLQRTDILLMCHDATKAFSDLYFSTDKDSIPFTNFSRVLTTYIYSVMMTLSKLSLFDAEDWDASNFQTTLNLSTVLDRVVTMTQAVSAKYDWRNDNKPWFHVAQKIRNVKARFEYLLANKNSSTAGNSSTQGQGDFTNISIPTTFANFDLFDDGFWQNLPANETIFI